LAASPAPPRAGWHGQGAAGALHSLILGRRSCGRRGKYPRRVRGGGSGLRACRPVFRHTPV